MSFLRYFKVISPALLACMLLGCGGDSSSSPATPTATATPAPTPSPTPGPSDAIIFSPAVTTVNNPTGDSPNGPAQFSITMKAFDSKGDPLTPSPSNPIHVDVYGALSGVISPPSTTIPSGSSLTFTYSGAFFPNNISINAWMTDPGTGGAAIGVTQVLMQNTSSCVYGTTSYQVPLTQTLPDALQVMADVGYSLSSAPAALTTYTIDTGSLGALVPSSELPHDSNVIGPAGPGVKVYNSSGNTYSGNYYLARVSVQILGGTVVQTIPIVVLGIDKAYCTGPSTKPCYQNPPSPTLHYLGVGFNRNSTAPGDLFNSPTANVVARLIVRR